MSNLPLFIGLAAGVLAAAYASFLVMRINKLPAGNEKMQEIAGAIQEGAMAYLGRQYRTVGIVAAVLAVALAIPGLLRGSRLRPVDLGRLPAWRRCLCRRRIHRHGHLGSSQRAYR